MTIQFGEKTITTPDNWNDCTLKQTLYCYGILMTKLSRQFEPQEVLPIKRLELMKMLMGIENKDLDAWNKNQLYEVSHAVTDFLLDEVETPEGEPEQYTIALKLTKNPYPYFRFPHKKKYRDYLAPADLLDNLSIYELGITFTIFEAYLNTQNEELIDKLIAILYREHKPKNRVNKAKAYEGDRRLPYLEYEATVPNRTKRIKKLPQMVKAIVLFWFASCRQEIINSYPNIFVQAGSEEKSGNDYGWGGVLMGLADGLVHLDEVSKQNYKNAFARLSWLEDQRKLMELKRAKV